MKLSKSFYAWVVLMIAVIIAAALGVQYPIPAPPEPVAIQVMDTARGVAQNAPYYTAGNKTMYFPAGSALSLASGALLTASGDVSTRNITTTGTLSVATTSSFAGATTHSAAINMSNAVINNIGNAGTDFGSDGSLTTAQAITATAGGVHATTFQPSASGSAAAAVYCMSSDCDTGLWYQGDNIIGITAGGTERGRVTTTGLDISPTLTIQNVSFTGPVKYGYVASQTTGAAITHGFATTPTVCLATPSTGVTTSIGTITTTGFTVDVSGTTPLFWLCGK